MYFRDVKEKRDLPLQDVLDILNNNVSSLDYFITMRTNSIQRLVAIDLKDDYLLKNKEMTEEIELLQYINKKIKLILQH